MMPILFVLANMSTLAALIFHRRDDTVYRLPSAITAYGVSVHCVYQLCFVSPHATIWHTMYALPIMGFVLWHKGSATAMLITLRRVLCAGVRVLLM